MVPGTRSCTVVATTSPAVVDTAECTDRLLRSRSEVFQLVVGACRLPDAVLFANYWTKVRHSNIT